MKTPILLLLLSLFTQYTFAQMGVNATGAAPVASAMLDVSSTNKGFLPPRMTTAQRGAIAAPEKGLLVYDATENELYVYNGTWKKVIGVNTPLALSSSIATTLSVSNTYANGNAIDASNNSATGATGIFANIGGGYGVQALTNTNTALYGFSGTGNGLYAEINGGTAAAARIVNNNGTGNAIDASNNSAANATLKLTNAGGGASLTTQFGNVGIGTSTPNEKLSVKGQVGVLNSSNVSTIIINPTDSDNTGAISFYNRTGINTIKIDADYIDGDGRIITQELQINGGSDLSENFDIFKKDNVEIKDGMLVSIDTKNEGKLKITDCEYDKKVVGVISGANGIKTGMLMGQVGSAADGEYPIALVGRVYVLASNENGEILPGDFLTSAKKLGYAQKVKKINKGKGGIIGKAMGKMDPITGYVLILINLQ